MRPGALIIPIHPPPPKLMANSAYKLGHFSDEIWQEHIHPPVFKYFSSGRKNPKIVATLPHGDPKVFAKLAECMMEPYLVLYVLHTPRGEGKSGRYQSPPLAHDELKNLLDIFGNFFASDSRFDLWIHSPTDQATLVWDRHNLIYAYGIAEKFLECLRYLRFAEGIPEIPATHEHHYRKEFDHEAARLLTHWEWKYSELHPEDEQ